MAVTAVSSRCLGLALFALLLSCDKPSFDEAPWQQRAQATLMPFKKSLKEALLSGLQEGPAQAIDACRVEAPRLAASASSEDVSVGRTSHKLRNPRNAPEPWMVPLLEAYRTQARRQPQVVEIDARTVGYVEPIYVQPMCLTCHGPNLPAPVREQLAAFYPEDQATGFEVGDFRGLFWVKMRR